MRSPRLVVVLVILLAAWTLLTNSATAQSDLECDGAERVLFSDERPPQLTVTRDGKTIMTLQFEPGTLVGVCFERRGPQGEMSGDVVVRATPGARSNQADRRLVTSGGSPVVVALTGVEVTR